MENRQDNDKIEYLMSKRIFLRPLESFDLENLANWRNKPEIHQQFFNLFPIAMSAQQSWYEDLLKKPNTKLFVIQTKDTNKAIGTIGFFNINWKDQSAELGNVLIGEQEHRGCGFGKEAARIMIHFAFTEMNLNRIYLYMYTSNTIAVNIYNSIGFRSEGVLREAHFHGGVFQDVCMMALLRREYITGLSSV